MQTVTIGFVGGGNMATSLIGGLIADGYDAGQIIVSEPQTEARERLEEKFGITTTGDNGELARCAEVIVLAVKPQQIRAVCTELGAAMGDRSPLIISIAAGVRSGDMQRWFATPQPLPLIRTMPNTPSLVGSGATGLYASPEVSEEQRELAEGLMRAVGLAIWVEQESELDIVTAVSGSGPAYFFLLMEMVEANGKKMGLSADNAHLLALQTAFGAAKMALESEDDPATLRQKVTSPGGTTERAIGLLEEHGIREAFEKGMAGAASRAAELADMLGSDN